MELAFAGLGWVLRAADAVGSDRFTESVARAHVNIGRAGTYAKTPAERQVLAGMTAILDALDCADADAREVLGEAASTMLSEMVPDDLAELESLPAPPEEG
ncbi:MAG: hypothetical protein FGM50_08645 [Mycobacterium sp.]|nr:hypothetical protein [Mycobacterium sp.]